MIQVQSILKVGDNSGAKTAKCIKVLAKSSNSHKDFASIGDAILVSVRSVRKNLSNSNLKKKVQKGQIYKAIVIRTKKGISSRKTGHSLSFDSNEIVLLNNQDNLIGSRIFGPITREIRALNYRRLMSQSKKLL